jgi:hypothetical protein
MNQLHGFLHNRFHFMQYIIGSLSYRIIRKNAPVTLVLLPEIGMIPSQGYIEAQAGVRKGHLGKRAAVIAANGTAAFFTCKNAPVIIFYNCSKF